MSYTQMRYLQTHDKSAEIAKYLAKATIFRLEGKPEQWARDCEVKALRHMEHSYQLREWDFNTPPPLPPSSYSRMQRQQRSGVATTKEN